MTAPSPLPDRNALVAELAQLRAQGLEAVAELSLPALDLAAHLAGTSRDDKAPQEAVERLLRAALSRFGGGDFQVAAECTFGLAEGLKYASATDRRQRAARHIHVSTERFRRSYEKRILQQTAEGLLTACREAIISQGATAGIEPSDPPVSLPRRRVRRFGRRAVAGAVAALILAALVILGVVFTMPSAAERLETRYDGKDPLQWIDDTCGRLIGSQPAHPERPPLIGVDGREVGTVEVRTWPGCEAVWGRVLWNDDPDATYQIPAGWTLHVEIYRPTTGSVVAFSEPSGPTLVKWAYGPMLATVRGCVYVEAYFANGSQETPHARTACVAP